MISWFRCVRYGLELNSEGNWPGRAEFAHPYSRLSVDNVLILCKLDPFIFRTLSGISQTLLMELTGDILPE